MGTCELQCVIICLFSSSPICTTIEAGNAVLDVLTGLYNPAGRTAVTWYTGNSQLPPMTNYSMVNRTYRYMKAKPLYKFGYGLSYTKFNYSDFWVSLNSVLHQMGEIYMCMCLYVCTQIFSQNIKPCESVYMMVTVTNIGPVMGSEVVQFYAAFQVK